MQPVLLDTDTLSGIMRQNATALANARPYLAMHARFTLSLMTRYEILRGLKAKHATTQQLAFERFCVVNKVFPLTDGIIVRASDNYADRRQRGLLIGDGDILIAATALEHGLDLVTNNTNHYGRIAGLQLQNWLVR
jgi:tRNA(fMet)-specific endonuclease VapC